MRLAISGFIGTDSNSAVPASDRARVRVVDAVAVVCMASAHSVLGSGDGTKVTANECRLVTYEVRLFINLPTLAAELLIG